MISLDFIISLWVSEMYSYTQKSNENYGFWRPTVQTVSLRFDKYNLNIFLAVDVWR